MHLWNLLLECLLRGLVRSLGLGELRGEMRGPLLRCLGGQSSSMLCGLVFRLLRCPQGCLLGCPLLCRFVCQLCGLLRCLMLSGFGRPLLRCLKCKLSGLLSLPIFSSFRGALCRFLRGFLFRGVSRLSCSLNLSQAIQLALRCRLCRSSFSFVRCRQGILPRHFLGRQLGISLGHLLRSPVCPVFRTLGVGGAFGFGSSFGLCGSLRCRSAFGFCGAFGFSGSLCCCLPLCFGSSLGIGNQFCLARRVDPLTLRLCGFLNPQASGFSGQCPRSREISILCAMQICPGIQGSNVIRRFVLITLPGGI